jgi:hypothetical protein
LDSKRLSGRKEVTEMHDIDRREAVQQLQDAWRYAAGGNSALATRHIHEALEVLDEVAAHRNWPVARIQTVHNYVEEGRAAMTDSNLLGMVLATLAALEELEGDGG